jgi:hypothetical protein
MPTSVRIFFVLNITNVAFSFAAFNDVTARVAGVRVGR